jgi:hypothetical protein
VKGEEKEKAKQELFGALITGVGLSFFVLIAMLLFFQQNLVIGVIAQVAFIVWFLGNAFRKKRDK